MEVILFWVGKLGHHPLRCCWRTESRFCRICGPRVTCRDGRLAVRTRVCPEITCVEPTGLPQNKYLTPPDGGRTELMVP